MKCPECGNLDAYIGLSAVDCINNTCKNFKGATVEPEAIPREPARSNPPRGGGSTGLSVVLISIVPKSSTVELTFRASGDPGRPNKMVEFFWQISSQGSPHVCTLSSHNNYYVAGIDADSRTVYTTQWRCTLDGISPSNGYVITSRIS